MKKHVFNRILFVSILTLSNLAFLLFATLPATATDFEIGTQFGISRLMSTEEDDSHITFTRIPSGAMLDIGSTPTSLYAMWYPTENFGFGPEFSYGSISIYYEDLWGDSDTETLSTLHLGGRAAFYLSGTSVSSPYLMGRMTLTQFSGENDLLLLSDDTESITSIGFGIGYRFLIKSAFALRVEGYFNRLMLTDSDEDLNEFGVSIGIGTNFGM